MPLLPFWNYPVHELLDEADQLEPEARWPYIRILAKMWMNDAALPYNERILASIAQVSVRRWRQVIGPQVMSVLVIIDQGTQVTHERLTIQWHKQLRMSRLQSGRSLSRWDEAKRLKSLEWGDAAGMPRESQLKKKERKKEERGHQGVVHISDALRATKVFKGH